MGEKRREKNRLTKESMSKLMNKTEEDFKTNGASIQDMVPVFEHYGIQVRIFGCPFPLCVTSEIGTKCTDERLFKEIR